MNNWFEYLNIESELEDYEKIHQSIERDIIFKGTNLWILVFAIVVASVGLNMNSTAVIIGAMLISPLMGPINGLGYSIATYDFALFRKALKNFSFAVIAGLMASTMYFLVSPVSTAHSELLARTSPTIYDVLIALFGGLAGILATTSRQKGNVIPGVAIATALMPPLCTAGYGMATQQYDFFFGALYLFTINAVFIGISAVVMSQVLKFPLRSVVEPGQRKRINSWISAVIIITLIPSIYFGYKLVEKERFTENATRFTRAIGVLENSYLMKQDINADKKVVTLVYGGNLLTDDQKLFIAETAAQHAIDSNSVIVQQGFSINGDSRSEEDLLNSEINRLQLRVKMYQDSVRTLQLTGQQLYVELAALFPAVSSVSYSSSYVYSDPRNKAVRMTMVYISLSDAMNKDDRGKINEWLQKRLNTLALKVFFEEL